VRPGDASRRFESSLAHILSHACRAYFLRAPLSSTRKRSASVFAASYADDLRKGHVICRLFAKRRELIRQRVEELAAEQQGTRDHADACLE